MFGVTPEEVARANRMHIDDELQVDEVLKVPHPFTTEVANLKNQVETLSAQQQAEPHDNHAGGADAAHGQESVNSAGSRVVPGVAWQTRTTCVQASIVNPSPHQR